MSLYLPEDFKKSPSHHVLLFVGGVARSFPAHRTNIIITFYSACQWETVYIFFVISIKFFWMYFRHEELLKKTFSSWIVTKTHITQLVSFSHSTGIFSGDMGRLVFLVQIYFRNTDHIEKSHHYKVQPRESQNTTLRTSREKKGKRDQPEWTVFELNMLSIL